MINYMANNKPRLSFEMFTKLYLIILAGSVASSAMANTHHPDQYLKSIRGKKDEGEKIVAHFCSNCHAQKPLIPLGAPREGVNEEWKPRVAKGLKSLMKHTSEGVNAMPPRGGCFECEDEQLLLAIKAMLSPKMLKQLEEQEQRMP